MESIKLDVKGMTCGGCVRSVTRVLSALDGVAKVDVSLENASAEVKYDAGKVAVPQMQDAIRAAGFETP